MSRKGTGKPREESNSANPRNTAGVSPTQPQPQQQRSGGNGGTGGDGGNGHDRSGRASQLSFSDEQIAERAYQIFEREGRTDGNDMEHWLRAERELRSEQERAGSRPGNIGSQSGMSPRPDEAPRSARRHQQQQSPAT